MRSKRGFRGWWIALAAALADRLTKLLAAGAPGGALVPGIIDLRPVQNRGMAFSMLSGQTLALTVFTALLIAGLVGWLVARPDAPALARAGLWLIVGGGLGHLYDRLATGSVTDLSTTRIRTKIAAILTMLTTLKSWSVISMRSFVAGASPTSIAFGS